MKIGGTIIIFVELNYSVSRIYYILYILVGMDCLEMCHYSCFVIYFIVQKLRVHHENPKKLQIAFDKRDIAK